MYVVLLQHDHMDQLIVKQQQNDWSFPRDFHLELDRPGL